MRKLLHDLLRPHFSDQLMADAIAIPAHILNGNGGAAAIDHAHKPWQWYKDINAFDRFGLMAKPMAITLR